MESILEDSGAQVGVLGSKLEAWEAFLESILGLVGVWGAKRQQERGLEGLGLAQGWLGTRKWAQHGPNLSQAGANLGPTWAQLAPTWSQLGLKLDQNRLQKAILSDLEAISRPLEACEARDPKF